MPDNTEEIQATQSTVDNGGSQEVVYADEAAKGLDDFLADTVGSDYLENVSERSQKKTEPVQTGEDNEDKDEQEPVDKETESKINSLLEKAESEGLTDEELDFMAQHGYEADGDDGDEDLEMNTDEDPGDDDDYETFEFPDEFVSDLDDFFADEDGYDPEKISNEERIKFAHQAIRKMRENQTLLSNALAENPDFAAFVSDVVGRGMDPARAIKEHFGEILEEDPPKPGTPEYDDWVVQRAEQKKERKRLQDLQKEQNDNFQRSIRESQEFIKENNWTDKQAKEYNKELDGFLQELARGVVSKKFMNLIKNGLNYSQDVKSAEAKGEIKGLNKKIKFKKRQGDGLPKLRSNKEEPKRTVEYDSENTEVFEKFLSS